jgi:PAS domain S-box-containing protein
MNWVFRILSDSYDRLLQPDATLNVDDPVYVRQVFRAFVLLGSPAMVLYLVAWLLFAPHRLDRMAYALALAVLTGISYLLINPQHYRAGKYLFLVGAFILASLVVGTAGGTLAAYYGVYLVLILLTAWLSGWRAACLMLFASIIVGLVMGVLGQKHLLPPPFGTPLTAWLTHTLFMLVISIFSYTMTRRMVTALQSVTHELDERKKLEEALRESEERYRMITSVMSDYTFASRYDDEGNPRAQLLDGAFERIVGYTPEEFNALGGWRAIVHPDDREQNTRDNLMLRNNQRVVTEIRIVTKSGETRWVRVYANPVWDEAQQRLIGVNGAVQDITERKLAEAALRESEKRYRSISGIIFDYAYAYELGADGKFHQAWLTEESFQRVTGYDWASIGSIFKLYHPADVERARQDVDKTIQGEASPGEYRIITRTGDVRWVYIRRQFERGDSGTVVRFYGAAQDITEQKRLEAELQQYTAHLEQIVEERTAQLRRTKDQIEFVLNNSTDAIALIEANGDIKTMNPAFASVFGDQVTDCIERILWVLADDSHRLTVGHALINALYDQEPRRLTARIVAQDGNERDFDLAFVPVQVEDELEAGGILVSAHDITNLKEIERFKERFVADALHDMATPIMGLTTRLYLVRREPDKLDEHVRALENQVYHLRNLLSDLRMLSQLDRGELALTIEAYDLNQIVRRVFDTYEPVALSKQQTFALDMDDLLPPLLIDSRQIERVIVNLIANAVNYTPAGKAISIRTALEGDEAVFSVTDQGIGVNADELRRIFERFYRTEQARQTHSSGTGLGLAIVKEIVELHGGAVIAQSEVGCGSTFTMRLPCNHYL